MGAKKIQFYPLDITYKVIEEKPQIYLFGRTIDNKQICVIDDKFQPYFYVFLKHEKDIKDFCAKVMKLSFEHENRQIAPVNAENITKKFNGRKIKVVKLYAKIPADVPILREVIKDWEMIQGIYEYDIPFVKRYLIDKAIVPLTAAEAKGDFVESKNKVITFKAESIAQFSTDSIKSPKILAFDIETYNPNGKNFIPEEHPIIMLSFYGQDFKKVITWKRFKTDLDYIEFVEGEADLINRFKEIIEHQRPDIIAGYFSDGFDFPYLLIRAAKYKITLDIGLDGSTINYKKGKTEAIQITGITHFDVFKLVKKTMGRMLETDSYGLDNVAAELLGDKKIEVEMDGLAIAWDGNTLELENFCKYNLKDSELTYRLAVKLLPNIEELAKIVGLPLFEVNRMAFSQLVESFILKNTKDFDEIAPNRPNNDDISERRSKTYQGAFVYEPTPGLYKDIVIFDFRSLYPSIISSHNIGPSTLNCDCCRDKAEFAPTEKKEYWFCKEKKGMIPLLVEDIVTRRMRIKEMLKGNKDPLLKARSESLKLLANSFYGYLGFFGARWYCFECALSVTAFGRSYITKVIDTAKEKGFHVLYSDTDSIFLALGEHKKEDAVKFVEKINEGLPGVMELEYEGFYPAGLFVSAKEGAYGAKKKYALLREDGTLKITGFETIRRNWSYIAKEAQENVLNIALKENNPKKAIEYIRGVITSLKQKKIPNEKLIIETQIQKDIEDYASIGPHVAVAKRMIEKGQKIGQGSVIKFIVSDIPGIIREKARLPEELEQGKYDSEYYINNQIIPSVDKIFEVLGFSKEEISGKKEQSKLGQFF